MRRIGTLSNRREADTFGDYLLTQEIRSQIDPSGDEWAVWVYDEDRLEEARRELQAFREHPEDEKYRNAIVEADRIRHREIRRQQQNRRQTVDMAARWRRPMIVQIPVTFGLVVTAVAVTIGTQFGQEMAPFGGRLSLIEVRAEDDHWIAVDPETGGTRRTYGLAEIRGGQIWRLVTPIFIHMSPWHLLFNLYWTVVFGSLIETRQSRWALLFVVLVTAMISNLSQYAFQGFGFGGLSGVGYGLFGYLWLLGRMNPRSDFQIPPNLVFLFMAWLLICMTGAIGPIANYAHSFGLLTGMALGAGRGGWEKMTGKA